MTKARKAHKTPNQEPIKQKLAKMIKNKLKHLLAVQYH